MTMKVAIVGSREYTNKRRIQEFIYKLKERWGDDLEIVSGGQKDGADGYAKKYALEFDMSYVEFPPSHYNHNMHCIRPRGEYNKPYYVSNYFKRNKQIAEYCDIIVAFITEGEVSRGTQNTIDYAKKEKKLIKIIN